MTDPITHEAETGIRQLEAYLAQQAPIPHQIVPRLPMARRQRNLLDLGFDPDCSGLAPANDGERLVALDYLNTERMLGVNHHDISALDRRRAHLAGADRNHLRLVGDQEGPRSAPAMTRYATMAARRAERRAKFCRLLIEIGAVLAFVALLGLVESL